MLLPQPCSPSTASMGQVLGQDKLMDPLQGCWVPGLMGAWCTGLVAGLEETHRCLWTEPVLSRSRLHMVGEVRGCWWDIFLTFSKLPSLADNF